MQNHRRIPPATLPDFTPVRRKPRSDSWTPERQRAFIDALADTGSVKHAAARIGMTPEGAYILRRAPGAESFAAAWLAALDHGIRQLEDIALHRAIHGTEVPVYSYGKLVGSRIVYNDRLIMFMLRNRADKRFAASASRTRHNWDAQDEVADEGENATERARQALREIRERLLADENEEQREYRLWQAAKAQGRAVILPEECEKHGASEEPGIRFLGND